MTKYLKDYMRQITKKLEAAEAKDLDGLIETHRTMIGFMQHERLIHFLVTMLFTVIFFITLGIQIMSERFEFLILVIMLLGLLAPYIKHYYFLENTVQKMYRIHDEMIKRKSHTHTSS